MMAFGEDTTGAELARARRLLEQAEHPEQQPADATQLLVNHGEINIDDLIASARARLELAPPAEVKDNQKEAPNAEVVNELLAKAAELKRTADSATAARAKITKTLADLTDGAEELTVHGATVFTVKPVVKRVLNTDYIKSRFPDIPGNEAFYTTSTTTVRNYK